MSAQLRSIAELKAFCGTFGLLIVYFNGAHSVSDPEPGS